MSHDSGAQLALLLLGSFRALVDELHAELARMGHADVRPVHGFVLQAIGADGATASELGRRLGVSKQAAAKSVETLERLAYVRREPRADDRRQVLIRLTDRGEDVLRRSAEIFQALRDDWARKIGSERLDALQRDLGTLVGAGGMRVDLPGWLTGGGERR